MPINDKNYRCSILFAKGYAFCYNPKTEHVTLQNFYTII